MVFITEKQQKLLHTLLILGSVSSSSLHQALLKEGVSISLISVKRELSQLVKQKILLVEGAGRAVRYTISSWGRVFIPVAAREYCSLDPDVRYGLSGYNFDLLSQFPPAIFSQEELKEFTTATKKYIFRLKGLSPVLQKKELERLIIELSWKSSKIEGNTYTLLDTEKLILENKEAKGRKMSETQMILNHKNAFQFVLTHAQEFKTLTRKNIEMLHKILVKDMGVTSGFRKNMVGITGSKYRPLDNQHQIREAFEDLCIAVAKMRTPYEKALVALLGIGYIQPFEDGNKRTSRLIANAILLAYRCAPLSYRSVDEEEYREATLVFYELNSIMPFKKIFIEQYKFAAENYAVTSK